MGEKINNHKAMEEYRSPEHASTSSTQKPRDWKYELRSAATIQGRRMAGARALWHANGMTREQMGKPIIAIANSFTQFVPGHVHLHDAGQLVKREVEKLGCFAAEFNTIAVDDGIAMGHDGMLYSLPSRDLIADSVEYMVNAHRADALVCISNCDKITPGMMMAAMRLNIPTIFVSGGPMETGAIGDEAVDLIDAMIESADESVPDERVDQLERLACPTCGSCSGMFTANSMNCLNEAIGLALPETEPSWPHTQTGCGFSSMRPNRSWRTPTSTTSMVTSRYCRAISPTVPLS